MFICEERNWPTFSWDASRLEGVLAHAVFWGQQDPSA